MRAVAALVAELSPTTGRTRCSTLRSDPPLTLRATSGDVVHLVGSAAGPVGGDELHLSVAVGAGGRLTVRSVAATVALPGVDGASSTLAVDVTVREDARLHWLPEPTIVARGCDHRASTQIVLAPRAELVWREVVVLGRHGEPGGSLLQRLRVDVAGRPLVRNDLAVGPRWPASLGPAGIGEARTVATALVVGPAAERVRAPAEGNATGPSSSRLVGARRGPAGRHDGVRVAALPLADQGTLITALAPHARAAMSALDAVLDAALASSGTSAARVG